MKGFLSCFLFCFSSKSTYLKHWSICLGLKSELWVMAPISNGSFVFRVFWFLSVPKARWSDNNPDVLCRPHNPTKSSMLQCFITTDFNPETITKQEVTGDNDSHTLVKPYPSAGVLHLFRAAQTQASPLIAKPSHANLKPAAVAGWLEIMETQQGLLHNQLQRHNSQKGGRLAKNTHSNKHTFLLFFLKDYYS